MAKKRDNNGAILNRRAKFDYNLGDELVVGMQLTGAETKALRKGQGNLRGAYVVVKDDELWLLNATITGDNLIRVPEDEHTRSRKLLAKRKEIDALIKEKQNGKSLIPVKILNRGRYIKLVVAVGTGKKRYDKRETIARREAGIAAQRAMKHKSR